MKYKERKKKNVVLIFCCWFIKYDLSGLRLLVFIILFLYEYINNKNLLSLQPIPVWYECDCIWCLCDDWCGWSIQRLYKIAIYDKYGCRIWVRFFLLTFWAPTQKWDLDNGNLAHQMFLRPIGCLCQCPSHLHPTWNCMKW